jgi:hypothetical protein
LSGRNYEASGATNSISQLIYLEKEIFLRELEKFPIDK